MNTHKKKNRMYNFHIRQNFIYQVEDRKSESNTVSRKYKIRQQKCSKKHKSK